MEEKYGQYGDYMSHSWFKLENIGEWRRYENKDGVEIISTAKGLKIITDDPETYLTKEQIHGEWREISIRNPFPWVQIAAKEKTELIYSYKDNTYKILGTCSFKHPETRKWVDAVSYQDTVTESVYVRQFDEFFNLFKLVE